MSELSPAAREIKQIIGDLYDQPVRCVVAAALRAVADQVVPPDPCGDDCCITQCEEIRAEILAIAAELEGQALPQPPTQPTTNHTP